MSAAIKTPTAASMDSTSWLIVVSGPTSHLMAIAGFPQSHPAGPLTGRAAGSGFPPLAGPGFRQNPGAGRPITMAGGLSFPVSAGHGCQGLDLSAPPTG